MVTVERQQIPSLLPPLRPGLSFSFCLSLISLLRGGPREAVERSKGQRARASERVRERERGKMTEQRGERGRGGSNKLREAHTRKEKGDRGLGLLLQRRTRGNTSILTLTHTRTHEHWPTHADNNNTLTTRMPTRAQHRCRRWPRSALRPDQLWGLHWWRWEWWRVRERGCWPATAEDQSRAVGAGRVGNYWNGMERSQSNTCICMCACVWVYACVWVREMCVWRLGCLPSAGPASSSNISHMLCHCKVACTNNTISMMFGCKVGKERSVSVCEGVCDSEHERERGRGRERLMDCERGI